MSTANVLVVDDEADIRGLIQEILTDEGYSVTVAASAAEAREANEAKHYDMVLLDIWMPETDGITLLREWSDQGEPKCPVVIMSGHGTVDTAVEATRLGAFDFIEKPLSIAKLLRTVERGLDSAKSQGGPSRTLLPQLLAPVGRSPVVRNLREQAKQFARLNSSVLLIGESGTGRAAFARYMHAIGTAADAPLVTVLSASLTEGNAEEQLAGRESQGEIHSGFFERAGNGVLLIEDLTDLNDQAQKLVLSVLEQRQFIRQGGYKAVEFRARVMGTVKADYEDAIAAGKLRRELISSLNTLTLRVPPLREFAEDVPELLSYYVDKLVDGENLGFRRFSVAAQNRLRNYPWPDNVHELKNLVRRLLLTGGEDEISLTEVENEVSASASVSSGEPLVKQDLLSLPLREAREQFERAYLQQQLTLCGGKVGKLAARVGMERTHLYRKLRSLGVDFRTATSKED
jgi:DNA-binding NtrC family response regulator